jgi:hypothetical protein
MALTPLESPQKNDFGDVLVAPKLPTESEIITKTLDPQGLGSPPATPRPPPLDTPPPHMLARGCHGTHQHPWGCLAMGGLKPESGGKVVHLGAGWLVPPWGLQDGSVWPQGDICSRCHPHIRIAHVQTPPFSPLTHLGGPPGWGVMPT